ncbi:carbon-nitrogen hydrolase [Candidatus Peribacteria bacterium]|nr:carbon-nitrogen hydrolase [Candidatus Peribacteria bacterium]
MSKKVTIGLVQMSMEHHPAGNLEYAIEMVAKAADKGAQIVCLPELFQSPYFCQKKDDKSAFDLAEPIPGPATKALSEAAKKHKIVLVGGSIFEKTKEGTYYNTTPVFDTDGSLLGTYRKTHIPEDILYHEKQYFSPGDTGIKVFKTKYGKICPLICYDQWFPEAARLATLQGAEILIYPTAIGVIDSAVEENITGDWEQMWRNVMLGHAAANNVYVCGLNRVGTEGAITFWGGSFIAAPSSEVLAKAGNKEEIILAVCDLDRVKAIQEAWMFLKNRRPEVYDGLTKH